jgi:putative molybdopterin biosynthesis protein
MYTTTMSEKGRAEPSSNIENRLRSIRTSKGLSQGELAAKAGITRQAVYAIENSQYLPTTAVALRLAGTLDCMVEDLFRLISSGEIVEGELVGDMPAEDRIRVKVARIGNRTVVRPVSALGNILNFTVPADGLIVGPLKLPGNRQTAKLVRVELLQDRRLIDGAVVVAGCDPAIYLAGEYLRRKQERTSVIEWPMGSAAAIEALKRGEVHVAGLHLVDAKTGESNLPYLRKHLRGEGYTVVTFAAWEAGLLVRRGNPKGIRDVSDLARGDVEILNREEGAGARILLDLKLQDAGIPTHKIKGYRRLAASHVEVAGLVSTGSVDAGIGVRAVAKLFDLDFIPLREERYDLVMPTRYLTSHAGLNHLIDTMVGRTFRTEIEALGGYDMRETGKVHELRGKSGSARH